MNDTPHRLLAALSVSSAGAGIYNWLIAHGPVAVSYAGGICAIVAAGFSMQASRATTKLRKTQQRRLEDE